MEVADSLERQGYMDTLLFRLCLALITPLGGTALLIGWALLLWHGIAGKRRA